MKIMLDEGAITPTRAHKTDAGLDIYTPIDVLVPARGSAIIHTGVHVDLPPVYCGLIVSKSGLNIFHNLISTGLIDEGYQNEVVAKIYNLGDESYTFNTGDKITQLVMLKTCYGDPIIVDEFTAKTERGNDGFGSTGR